MDFGLASIDNSAYQKGLAFDRFGYRYLKASENPSNQNPLAPTPIEDNNIERTTNRFAANTGTVYDDAGNVVSDDKFREMDFVYDANGRMAKAIKANFPEALSVFDAGGNKVATRVNDVWRFQIYDAGGKCVAEYGGPQSADDGGVKYTHQDIQGSTRTISTQAGFAQARMDYQAFGEQISSGIGQRTTTGYTTSDTLRNRYALTERDEATGLDDTWFRKLENRGGRWTSPDPYNGSANIGNGQSWNRYSYVENQPTNLVDPSGLLALSWVCWDLTTYYSNANGDQLTRTTTQCDAFWVGGSDGGSGIDVGDGGGNPQNDPATERCKGFIKTAADAVTAFLKEWAKYDPEQDAVGGIKHKWGVTQPFGHWKKLKDIQNTMKNAISNYDRHCNDRNDNRGGRGGPLPVGVRSLATQRIPRKEGPGYRIFEAPSSEKIKEALNQAAKNSAAAITTAAIITGIVVWILVN